MTQGSLPRVPKEFRMFPELTVLGLQSWNRRANPVVSLGLVEFMVWGLVSRVWVGVQGS